MQKMHREIAATKSAGEATPPYTSDAEINSYSLLLKRLPLAHSFRVWRCSTRISSCPRQKSLAAMIYHHRLPS
ncbi:conserved hypothetical protein [Ricinus communis]|uniref:Uncharacterized protein n=1 Tax=Ricinus communis TaxID=3988 RepID=B9T6S4_RICCO|nr:conserved hypothetical protein [Ricinus communis]